MTARPITAVAKERLNSWKEIAAYLNVSVRTVQRWEAEEGLPVQRHQHVKRSSVYVDAVALDRWWHSRPSDDSVTPQQRSAGRASKAIPSIAVLPFENLDRDERTEILADGLTEDMITAISRIRQLRVVARTSVFYFKGKPRDIREIGSRLGVDIILEGSVRRAGNRLRVTAQLVSAADGCHLWSERIDREIEGAFDIEDELVDAIADRLRVRLLNEDAATRRTDDIETYNTFLRARYFWNQRTEQGLRLALQCFEACVARDAEFAAAYAGLADCYTFLWVYGGCPRHEVLPRARAAVDRALEIDPMLAEAHTSQGLLENVLFKLRSAESAFRRALDLNSGDHQARHWSAMALACLGRTEEAVSEITEARELDPLGFQVNLDAGRILLASGRIEPAIARLRRALELAPGLGTARVYLMLASLRLENYREALELAGDVPEGRALVRARMGETDEATGLLRKWQRTPPSFIWKAVLEMALGHEKSALDSFKLSAERYEPEFLQLFLGVSALFDALASNSEFTGLLRK